MNRHAFSLIELLVVIGIIAVLIGLAIPVVSSVRMRSFEMKSQSNLSQIGKTIELYTGEYRSYFFGTSGPTRPSSVDNQGWVSFPIWGLRVNWPLLVHAVAPWNENYEIWVSPKGDSDPLRDLIVGQGIESILPVSYHYSNSFVATPRVWEDSNEPIGDQEIRSIKPSMVRYPSGKVIAFDAKRAYLRHEATLQDSRPVLLSDGSSRMVIDTDSTAPAENQLRFNYTPYWYHDTPSGIHGRDL